MKGLIVNNSYLILKSQELQNKRLSDEFKKYKIDIDFIKSNNLRLLVDGEISNKLREKYDFVLYLDKDKYISRILEKTGIKIFNNSDALEFSDDKMLTHIKLSNNGIKMPKTIPGLLNMNKNKKVDLKYLDFVENELDYPLVVKECYGSLGKNVYLINNRKQLIDISKKLINKEYLYQEFIETSYGRDVRVILIGNKVVASMMRESDNDFRSNIELNGEGYPIDLPDTFKNLAEKTSKILGLDYCGIDILFGKKNEPFLCEVNPKAFFNKIEEVTGINVAEELVKYIIKEVKKEKENE